MNDFVLIMEKIIALLKIEFTMYGVTISFWQIGLWVAVATIVVMVIVAFLSN